MSDLFHNVNISCGKHQRGKDKKVERVTTESGAISVEALDMPDYITEADDDDEEILMAKEGEGYGVGEYVLISGIYSPGVSSAKKQFRSKKQKLTYFLHISILVVFALSDGPDPQVSVRQEH